jgi:transcriptional regulator GlxA family with amidase domain
MLSQLDARRGVVLDVGDTPQPVRRALIFIDEHAGDPITLNEIALAARLSPRGLQAAFRRHLHTTPLAYLHSVRMERAHRDLQSADPDDNMSAATSVARLRIDPSWRFAIAYRRRFGTSPSQTLRSQASGIATFPKMCITIGFERRKRLGVYSMVWGRRSPRRVPGTRNL